MIQADDDQGVRLGVVEDLSEPAHTLDSRVELVRVFAWLAQEKRRRVTGNH
jgi:hypothetical protein